MHGLIADRFLKRFAGRTLHRPQSIPTDMTGSEPDHDEEMSRRSDGPEKATRGKEEPGNIEKTDEITKPLHPDGGSDRPSGVTQPPDGDCQKIE
jgi:hypothetical protein